MNKKVKKLINQINPHIYPGPFLGSGYYDGYETCREMAARNLFKGGSNKIITTYNSDLINILSEIEDRIGLSQDQKTQYFIYSNSDKFLVLKNLQAFWSKNAIRRRLLLTIVKCFYGRTNINSFSDF